MKGDGPAKCHCGSTALFQVDGIGYCRYHYSEAVEAVRKAKALSQSRHGLKQFNALGELKAEWRRNA